MTEKSRLFNMGVLLTFGFTFHLLVGCATEEQKLQQAEKRNPPQPVLVAETTWFADTLSGHLELEPLDLKGLAIGSGSHSGGRNFYPGGTGRLGSLAGSPASDDGYGRRARTGSETLTPGRTTRLESSLDESDDESTRRGPQITPPREALFVAFTNHGTEPVDISVPDVNSVLGNFAVRPEHLVIAPGATAELEPMKANYAANLERVEVEIRVKIKDQSETKKVMLSLAAFKP